MKKLIIKERKKKVQLFRKFYSNKKSKINWKTQMINNEASPKSLQKKNKLVIVREQNV